MPNKARQFGNNGVYHLFNRGVEKRPIFSDSADYNRFLLTLAYYQQTGKSTRFSLTDFKLREREEPLRFELFVYCMMPNHFHIILKQNIDNGISQGISQLLNSYVRYFNTRHDRIGPLFQGKFQTIEVTSDEQLIHLARYIFLNPYAARMTDDISQYPWSAYREYLELQKEKFCNHQDLLDYFPDLAAFKNFVLDYADYARQLDEIKKLVLE